MRILNLVIRNTSTLDYSLPLLCRISQRAPDTEIYILYCVINRKQLMREAHYYDEICEKHNIRQLDYSDFFAFGGGVVRRVIRAVFSTSYYDNISLRSFLKHPFWPGLSNLRYYFSGFRQKLDHVLSAVIVNTDGILPKLKPDVILLDYRRRMNFLGRREFEYYFEESKTPIVLVPHAAHVDNETDEYYHINIAGKEFPPYCDHWSSFIYSKPYLKAGHEKRNQFSMVGHPGLDSVWLEDCTKHRKPVNKAERLTCLVMSRKFLAKGLKKTRGMDPGVLEYSQCVEFLAKLNLLLKESGSEIELLVKPHPSSSHPQTARLLQEAGCNNARITAEPLFAILRDVDFAITEFTTSIAFTVLAGIPTIVVHSPLQDYVHFSWDRLKELYTGLQFYVSGLEEAGPVIRSITAELYSGNKCSVQDDVLHFRGYYQDGAVDRGIERIKLLVSRQGVSE